MKITLLLVAMLPIIAFNVYSQDNDLLLRYLNDKAIVTIDEHSNYNVLVFMCKHCGNCDKTLPGFLEKLIGKKENWIFIFDVLPESVVQSNIAEKAIIVEDKTSDLVRYDMFHAHHMYFEIIMGSVSKNKIVDKNGFKSFVKSL